MTCPAQPSTPDRAPAAVLALLGAGGHAGVALRLLDACLDAARPGRGEDRAQDWRSGGPSAAPFTQIVVTGAAPAFLEEARAVLAAHLAPHAQIRAAPDDAALRAGLADAPRVLLVNGVGRRPTRRRAQGPGAWSGGEAAFLDDYEAESDRFVCPALLHPGALTLDRMIWTGEGWRAAAGPGGIAPGAQLHAGCVLGARARVGRFAIVNTRASLDHDCMIGARAFVGPGATLCGGVCVEPGAFIGAGATILPGVRIGRGAVVPAGATARGDVAPGRIAAR